MRGIANNIATDEAFSALMSWWAMAGVDSAVAEAPVNWLRPAPARPAHAARADVATPGGPQYPGSVDKFHEWFRHSEDQPEAAWPGERIIPACTVNQPLMIITDVPDPEDARAGVLLAGDAGKLVDAMLVAAGISRGDVGIASVALTRPPGGMMDAKL